MAIGNITISTLCRSIECHNVDLFPSLRFTTYYINLLNLLNICYVFPISHEHFNTFTSFLLLYCVLSEY